MRFSKDKCKVIYGQNNHKQQYRLESDWLGCSSAETDLMVLKNSKLKRIQKCALEEMKANSLLVCIRNSMASRTREEISYWVEDGIKIYYRPCLSVLFTELL